MPPSPEDRLLGSRVSALKVSGSSPCKVVAGRRVVIRMCCQSREMTVSHDDVELKSLYIGSTIIKFCLNISCLFVILKPAKYIEVVAGREGQLPLLSAHPYIVPFLRTNFSSHFRIWTEGNFPVNLDQVTKARKG